MELSQPFGPYDDGQIHVYGTWFGSQFNLWFFTPSLLEGGSIVIQYLWNGQVYDKIQYDDWAFIPGKSYTASTGSEGLTVSISEDGSAVFLELNKIPIAGGDIVIDLPTRGFYRYYDQTGNDTFCGNLGSYEGVYTTLIYPTSDPDYHSNSYMQDGLPAEAWIDPNCRYE